MTVSQAMVGSSGRGGLIPRRYFTMRELRNLLPGAAAAMSSGANRVVFSTCARTGNEFRVERVIVSGAVVYSVKAAE